MPFKRRDFLKHSAATLALIAAPRLSIAQTSIGEGTITTVSDGNLVLPKSFILGDLPEADVEPILNEYGVSGDSFTPPCNLTLYQDGENKVLFDVGSGPDFQPSAGQVLSSLEAIGVAPDDITHVVFTHAHPDHIWGLLDDFDEPAFYNAQYMMGRGEWDYWWNPETVNNIGEERAAFAVGAKRRMEAIEDSVEFFDADQEILPGIQSISTAGHTPGHMSFEVRQGQDAILVIGDAIANHHVAFRRPEWLTGNDQDPETAAKTRTALFDRITADQLKISGFHLPDGGIGHADASEGGFVFVAEGS